MKKMVMSLFVFMILNINFLKSNSAQAEVPKSYLSYLNPFSYLPSWKGSVNEDDEDLMDEDDEDFMDEDFMDEGENVGDDEDEFIPFIQPSVVVKDNPSQKVTTSENTNSEVVKNSSVMDKLKNVIGVTSKVKEEQSLVNNQVINTLNNLKTISHGNIQQLTVDSLNAIKSGDSSAKSFVKSNMRAIKQFIVDEINTSMKDYNNQTIAEIEQLVEKVLVDL